MDAPMSWLKISVKVLPEMTALVSFHVKNRDINTNVFDWDGDYNVTVADFLMM